MSAKTNRKAARRKRGAPSIGLELEDAICRCVGVMEALAALLEAREDNDVVLLGAAAPSGLQIMARQEGETLRALFSEYHAERAALDRKASPA